MQKLCSQLIELIGATYLASTLVLKEVGYDSTMVNSILCHIIIHQVRNSVR